MRNGQYQQAEQRLHQLLKKDPDSIWYNSTLAEVLQYQQRLDEALAVYKSQLLLYPDDLALGSRLTRVLLMQGENDQALQHALRLKARHSKIPGVYSLLVQIYQNLDEPSLKQLAEADYQWANGNQAYAQKLYKKLMEENVLDAAEEARLSERIDRDVGK